MNNDNLIQQRDLCKVDCLFICICIFYIIGWIELYYYLE